MKSVTNISPLVEYDDNFYCKGKIVFDLGNKGQYTTITYQTRTSDLIKY